MWPKKSMKMTDMGWCRLTQIHEYCSHKYVAKEPCTTGDMSLRHADFDILWTLWFVPTP